MTDFSAIAATIIQLSKEDLQLREKLLQSGQMNVGYHPEMEKLHSRNAKILEEIIDTIGYPIIEKVGSEASSAACLIIQHAIALPEFMRKCRKLMELAANEGQADAINLAYLSDRIAVLEGKPQKYGTQFDWDENGKLSPNAFDDLKQVNLRRKSIGLNSLEEQTELIRARAKEENQLPPKDLNRRNREYESWRKSVGWI